jgi:hypothetical protein
MVEKMSRLLSEGKHVRLGTRLEECDLSRPLADRVVLSHELVQAPFPEQPVSLLVDVHAVYGPGASPSRSTRKVIGSRAPGESTRCASRAWKR